MVRKSAVGAPRLAEAGAPRALILCVRRAAAQKWVRWSLKGPWLLPVLGGYASSIALFNLVEPFNQRLLAHLAYAYEGIVSKLANPADKRVSSLLLAAITPCVGAPLFEELQSRAFILQARRNGARRRVIVTVTSCRGRVRGRGLRQIARCLASRDSAHGARPDGRP